MIIPNKDNYKWIGVSSRHGFVSGLGFVSFFGKCSEVYY